jgi:hypothetical protein
MAALRGRRLRRPQRSSKRRLGIGDEVRSLHWPDRSRDLTVSGTNWAGNYRYQATKLHRPATLEQLQQVVAAAPRIRVLGSRHSFTDLPDSAELVSLEGLPTGVAVDRAELQSEYLLPRRHAIAAIQAVHALAELVRPVLQVSELRTVAADRLWMSPQHEQDTIAIPSPGTPTDRRPAGARGAGGRVRPVPGATSLGKVFVADATAIAPLYERLPDFQRLVDRLDPRGAFRNPGFATAVSGPDDRTRRVAGAVGKRAPAPLAPAAGPDYPLPGSEVGRLP